MTSKRKRNDTYKRTICNGYWLIYIPSQFKTDKKGRVYEHVYFYEQYHKCCMLPWGDVHHITPIKKGGSNMPWNLQGMMQREHSRLHNIGTRRAKKNMSKRFCDECGSNKTYIKRNGISQWHKNYMKGYWCNNCNARLFKKILC